MDYGDDLDSFINLVKRSVSCETYSDACKTNSSTNSTTTSSSIEQPIEEQIISNIILNVRLKFDYDELIQLIKELKEKNSEIKVNQRTYSVFELHTLYTTMKSIDMSNQKIRKIYRPYLFIRKADAFGAWNFNFLLGLFDIDYECYDKNK